ncbi:MAG: Gfo/Idh/MocA family protein [Geminicoccaceae bacterium]
MSQLRIGVIGAGLIAQVEHIPNLLRLRDKFVLAVVSDPSPTARAFVEENFAVPTVAEASELLARPLDAVLVASPDALHLEQVEAGLAAGLHVFCEKPLCYGVADIDRLIAARDRAGRICQVGYMKRFDPSYEAALRLLSESAATLRYVSVEVNDPDAWPFVRHHLYGRAADVPPAEAEAARALQREQVARAVGRPLVGALYQGFVSAYCSSLVHDVNAVHGLLDALGVPDGEVIGAQLFAGGDGGLGTVRLQGGRSVWNMAHLTIPGLADYTERIALYFDDALLELVFPSPWLNHQPTRLVVRRSTGHLLDTHETRSGFEEAYIRELEGFWSSVVEDAPVRNGFEDARRDQRLLCALAAHAAGPTA